MDASTQLNPWINRTIGDRQRYRVVSRLGGGGMGDVFLAMDTLLGQEVALKLLKEKLLGEGDLRRRFEREVLLCAALRSDHVVQVKDYGVTPEGNPFYVMEYLRGQTLGQLLNQEKQIPVDRTIDIVMQVCAGLHSAHSGVIMWHEGSNNSENIQVVHRDLKPENIFLVHTTLGELVKVLDFGIAKISSNRHQGDSTHTGIFMGTFQYAAPEQLEGSKDVDERADIYSLGMILYEMLSGTDPFSHRNAQQQTNGGVYWIRAHTSVAPRPLRSQLKCEHIPIELDMIVLQCLQKKPDQRYGSADDLYKALRLLKGSNSASTQIKLTVANSTVIYPTVTNSILPGSSSSPKSNPSLFLTSQLKLGLETLLTNYIGPIAPILLKQTLAETPKSYTELISKLLKHVPANHQKEFQTKAKALDNSTVVQSETPTTKVTTDSTIASAPNSNLVSQPEELEPDFISRCQQELIQFIGPIAPLIVQKTLKQKLSRQKFIDTLAEQIPASDQAQIFRNRLRS